jgi:putative oxidoreductase
MLNRYFNWFEQRAAWGPLFIRLAIGMRLVQGTADNVFSYARMEEFAGFLAAHGTPFPLAGAFLSAYVQFICGILVILGLFTRPAGLLIAINFVFALVIAHRATAFLETWPAAMMLAGGLFFLFNGSGAFAFDRLIGAGSRDRLSARRQTSLS